MVGSVWRGDRFRRAGNWFSPADGSSAASTECSRRRMLHGYRYGCWLHRTASLALMLCTFPAACGWTFGRAPAYSRSAESLSRQYQLLVEKTTQHDPPSVVEVLLYARKGKSCEAGNVAAHTARGDTRARDGGTPWFHIGRLICTGSTAKVPIAIQARRSMLVNAAREQHKPLRPFATLLLSWAEAGPDPILPRLGSFRCPKCSASNDAKASACYNCGAQRPENVGDGSLTLAVAPRSARPLAADEYGIVLATDDTYTGR